MKQYIFGIDIGGTTVKCGLFTAEGECLDKWEIVTNRDNHGEKVPQDIADTIKAKMAEKVVSEDAAEAPTSERSKTFGGVFLENVVMLKFIYTNQFATSGGCAGRPYPP